MGYMTDSEAKETIDDMGGAMRADCLSLVQRIDELKADYQLDPWQDTKKQITRLEERLVIKRLQVEALAIAAEKFGDGVRCEAWTSHDDVGGEGEQTFYHECGKGLNHKGRHSCIGHMDLNTHEAGTCREEW